jgi:hypothetical protein
MNNNGNNIVAGRVTKANEGDRGIASTVAIVSFVSGVSVSPIVGGMVLGALTAPAMVAVPVLFAIHVLFLAGSVFALLFG